MSAVPSPAQSPEAGSFEWKVARARHALEALLRAYVPVCVSWSAGKDSSTVLNLLLTVAAHLRRQGVRIAPIVVTHADTGIENPSMAQYARDEMRHVRAFARANDLDVRVLVSHPNLTDTWAVRVIGGRALPPFPGMQRDCSLDWKALPQKRLRKQVLKELEALGAAEPVVLLGTRYSESTTRAANMRERGESDVEVRRGVDENGKPSHLFLSPIAYWDTDDVWEYLGMVRSGLLEGYSTFEETARVYADAMGVSCVIVAEDMSKSVKASKACGARHGCSLCTATGDRDASMENMLASDPRYAYMRPLNRLRNFLIATRWDMDRRTWLGRTIKNGYVRVAPDTYSPAMMEELLRYALTIDARERDAASREGIRPRFHLVDLEQVFAIDAMWSLQGFHRPFHALAIWDEVVNRGERFDVPELATHTRPKEFPERYFWVGQDWEDGDRMAYTGLRSAAYELTTMDQQDGCMGLRELPDGRAVMDINTGSMLEFDLEGACFVLDELPQLLKRYHDNPQATPTEAYFYYARLGIMTVKSGMQGEIDAMLRRTSWKFRNGVAGQVDGRSLWERSVTREEAGMEPTRGVRVRGAAGSLSVAHLRLVDDAVTGGPQDAPGAAVQPPGDAVVVVAAAPPSASPAAEGQLTFWEEECPEDQEQVPGMRS